MAPKKAIMMKVAAKKSCDRHGNNDNAGQFFVAFSKFH